MQLPNPGENVNVAAFGRMVYWTGADASTIEPNPAPYENGAFHAVDAPEQGGKHLGLEWEAPRQFEKVVVAFAPGAAAPDPSTVRLQYHQHSWPARSRGGWTHIDDPYNGRWLSAHGDVAVNGNTWTFTFDPLDITEHDNAADFAVFYRQSNKLRLLFKDDTAPVASIRAYSDSVWREAALQIEYTGKTRTYSGDVSVYSGYLLDKKDVPGGMIMKVLYADCASQMDPTFLPTPPDRTVVTLAGEPYGAAFAPMDAVDEPIYAPDADLYIRMENGPSMDEHLAKQSDLPAPIYDRILSEPEQDWTRARREIPELKKIRQHRYVPLGVDSNRQEFALYFNGDIFMDKRAMKVIGRDTAKLLWPGGKISYRFPTGDPADFRDRENATKQSALKGYLPIFVSQWKDREIEFERTDFAAYLADSPWNEEQKRGDEPLVAMSRIKIRNTTEDALRAKLWLVIEEPEELCVEDGFVYATARLRQWDVPEPEPWTEKRWVTEPYKQKRMRAFVSTGGKGSLAPATCSYAPFDITGYSNAVVYEIDLPARTGHTIEFKIPFITFMDGDGEGLVRACDFDAKLAEMTQYWDEMIGSGASIETPEALINDYNKATLPHIAITGDKVVETGDYMLPAGTYSYQVCANEACHQIRALDFRGHHERARKYLMPYIRYQGTRGMHGRFKTQEGVLHGLKVNDEIDYQTFAYNLDHGFVLFALCEHYFLTGDREWAQSIADNLVAACDFVTRERQSTMKLDEDGNKTPEYGLIPPGHLEDNPEWLFWYAVNAYCHRGMAATVAVLKDLGHPEAERIERDTADYRTDLRASIKFSMEHAPMMRLADGTYSPYVPTRAQLRGRDVGWIRDSLYGPIHAIECGVLDYDEDISTWILKDTEDNVFVSRYRGRQIDIEKHWFSRGGNTIQSGLLPNCIVYTKRNQPEHAIRSLYNAFAQNLYEDVRCFTEHPVATFGLGAGPFYKTPDENCWINWLRNVLLTENGFDEMVITPAAPRKWFADGESIACRRMATYFGPVSFEIVSEVNSGRITANIDPPARRKPSELTVTLRHPEKLPIKSVTVNGQAHSSFDAETVTLTEFSELVEIVAEY